MSIEPYHSSYPPGAKKRNSSKAVVVRNGRILLTINSDRFGSFHLLPGGGQKFRETLHQALVREVLEETGCLVKPGRLLLIREYIGTNHEFAEDDSDTHQVEHIFEASQVGERDSSKQSEPDAWQTGVEWVSLENITGVKLYPSVLISLLPDLVSGRYTGPVYLGDVN